MYLSLHVKSLMGLKIWWSWRVDKAVLKSEQVRVFLKNHAQLRDFRPIIPVRNEQGKQNKQANQIKQARQIMQAKQIKQPQ